MSSEQVVSAPRIEKVHCNSCGQTTRHTVLVERQQPGSEPYDEEISISWLTTWTTLECCGCESVCLRRSFWFSEWGEDQVPQEEFFPPPISRRLPRWLGDLAESEQGLLKEVYAALHSNNRRLAMMGARTLLDVVMQRHAGDIQGFAAQLTALVDRGLISNRDRIMLSAVLDVGHASIHRGHLPSLEDTSTVMDIVENMLHIELLNEAVPGLRDRTPQRPRRPRANHAPKTPDLGPTP
jgi:hypothetical protein